MLALRMMCGMGAWFLWCVSSAASTGLALLAPRHTSWWIVQRFAGTMFGK